MNNTRSQRLVKNALDKIQDKYTRIDLGEVMLIKDLSPQLSKSLLYSFENSGLDIISDKKELLVMSVKTLVIKMIHYSDELPAVNYSVYIGSTLGYNYTYLANLFSAAEGMSIERFIIIHKIEKVKSYILEDKLSFKQIAGIMHYSSVPHLCFQFKKVTGLTPSAFAAKTARRKDEKK